MPFNLLFVIIPFSPNSDCFSPKATCTSLNAVDFNDLNLSKLLFFSKTYAAEQFKYRWACYVQ